MSEVGDRKHSDFRRLHATFFESETPCAYIDRSSNEPLRLRQFTDVWPFDFTHAETGDWSRALAHLEAHIGEFGSLATKAEHGFVHAYFSYLKQVTTGVVDPSEYDFLRRRFPKYDPNWVFDAPLPLPQAHLYVVDPLHETEWDWTASSPKNMFKVDFAFWAGEELVAVEIDGGSHIGSEGHIRKDRMLQRAGVSVIHILNREVEEQPEAVIRRLLPKSITEFWNHLAEYPHNPLAPLPF